MVYAFRRLALGILLIALASAILLVADRERRAPDEQKSLRLAIFQHADSAIMEDGVRGMIDGLAARGYRDGRRRRHDRAFQRAGRHADRRHDRAPGDGRRLRPRHHLEHAVDAGGGEQQQGGQGPPRLHARGRSVRVGRRPRSREPADRIRRTWSATDPSRLSKRLSSMRAGCCRVSQRIGVAWNPAESNSLAFVEKGRAAAAKLGFTLLEANADIDLGSVRRGELAHRPKRAGDLGWRRQHRDRGHRHGDRHRRAHARAGFHRAARQARSRHALRCRL